MMQRGEVAAPLEGDVHGGGLARGRTGNSCSLVSGRALVLGATTLPSPPREGLVAH